MESRILLTFDIDWAPEHALEDLYSYLKSSGAPATVFFTHSSPVAKKISELPGVETAVHPNFVECEDEVERFDDVLKMFPTTAKGVRTHSLYFHTGLLKIYHQKKIEYLSHDIFFLHPKIEPFYDWSGMVRLPIFWEDDVHASYFAGDFEKAAVDWNSPGLKIFNFHPIHLFLNTGRFEDYLKAKPDLKDEKKATAHRRSGEGVRTFFESVLKAGAEKGTKMIDVCGEFKKQNRYGGKYTAEGR